MWVRIFLGNYSVLWLFLLMPTSKVFLSSILGLSIDMRWLNQSQLNMQAKIMRWGQVIFIPIDNIKIMLLFWSAALSYWISPWGMERVEVRSTVQTVGGRLGVNKLSLFLERKSLIYHPPSLKRANISTGVRVTQVTGNWVMSSCLISQQVLLGPSLSDLFWLSLGKLHAACSDSQVSLV